MNSDIYFSLERKEKLMSELDDLQNNERAKVASEIELAKSHGDLSENAEYHSARERQAKVEDRIREIEYLLKFGQVISADDVAQASVGHTVVVKNIDNGHESTYQIVGSEEQNILEKKISNTSPIAKAILGHQVGEVVSFMTPNGEAKLEIIKISN